MNAVVNAATGTRAWREAARDWLQQDGPAWIFVAKTLIAAFLALWIGFRLDLDGAKSAVITVIIVAQPHSGNVLAKSFYRVLGTLVGLLVTIAMVQAFGQTRDLFIVAVCLWVGLCITGAAYFRNFQSYAFLLAGYTSCLIGFPAAEHAEATFDIALSRATAVMLGILCAAFVAEALLPQRLSNLMVTTVRGRYREFSTFVRAALAGELDHAAIQQAHNRFSADVLKLETQRAAAYFEDPEARIRDERLRLFNAEFMAALTSLHALHQWMERLRREQRHGLIVRIAPAYAQIDEALCYQKHAPTKAAEAQIVGRQLHAVRPGIVQLLADARHSVHAVDIADFDCAAELLLRFADSLQEYTEAYGSLADVRSRAPRRAPRLLPHTDPLAAAIMGLRAAATLAILCVFWIATAWPNGGSVATIAAVVCALFAQAPAPQLAAKQMRIGFTLGLIAAFICAFAVLPQLDGFPLLVAAMTPFLMISTWMTTIPKLAGIGTGFNLMFLVEMGPENAQRASALAVVNDGFAQLLGVTVAGIAFSTLIPAGSRWLRRRSLKALRGQVGIAATASPNALGHRIESQTRDLLMQLLPAADRTSGEDRRLVGEALSILEVSDALITARAQIRAASLDSLSRRGLRHAGRKLAQYYAQPGEATLRHALAALEHASQRLNSIADGEGRSAAEQTALQALLRGLYRLRRALLDPDTAADIPTVDLSRSTGHAA